MPTKSDLTAANARWAAYAFEALLAFEPHAAERAELRTSGVPASGLNALYPAATFTELLGGISEHLCAHHEDVYLTMISVSDPVDITGHKVDLGEAHGLYASERLLGEGSPSRSRGYALLNEALSSVADFESFEVKHLYLLLWHAWWLQTHRELLAPGTREYADELMLAAIEYALPALKTTGQPRFAGFHSDASDELY